LFVSWHGVWTQGLVFARQKLYHLSHATSPFCFGYVSDSLVFLPGAGLRCSPSAYGLPNSWITDICCHTWLIGWDRVLITFCTGWPQIWDFLISVFHEAGITEVYHLFWPWSDFFSKRLEFQVF
jgi:hypothetical protein